MGCASSSAAQTQPTTGIHYPSQQPSQQLVSANVFTSVKVAPIVIQNVPEAPKSHSRKSSSSSSSSDDSSVDLKKQREDLKKASAVAATKSNEAKLTVDILQQYNSLTIVILQLERKNVVQKLDERMRLSIEVKNQASKLNDEYRQLQLKTNKELQDVQNLQSLASAQNMLKYFQDQVQFDTQMSKEQEEYIQAKTEMEDCHKRLTALQIRQSNIEAEVKDLTSDHAELMKHYKGQDEILDSIFNGDYGSELEEKLEGEFDKQQDRKQRIEVAWRRWKNAEILVNSACQQLSYANDRWQSCLRIPSSTNGHKMLRIQVAAEVRNYLLAASQNLSSANRSLGTVKFPYCDQSEIATLNKAITYIFVDVNEKSRHDHAGNVYRTTRDRCFLLGQWINKVITSTVLRDLNKSRQTCSELHALLRAERSKLMREKIEEETGEKITWEETPTDSGNDSDADSDSSGIAAEAEKVPESQDLDQQIKDAQEDSVEGEGGETTLAETGKPVAVPLDELAPAPKQDELFGNLEVVMAEYDKQRDEYSKEMEANRARQQADFQMKLKARRSRKRRMMAQEQELNELIQKEKDAASIEVPNAAA